MGEVLPPGSVIHSSPTKTVLIFNKIPLPESGVSAISLILDNSLPKNQNVKISVDQTNPWRSFN